MGDSIGFLEEKHNSCSYLTTARLVEKQVMS